MILITKQHNKTAQIENQSLEKGDTMDNKDNKRTTKPKNRLFETTYERLLGQYSDVAMLNGLTIETNIQLEIFGLEKSHLLDQIRERLQYDPFEQRIHLEERLNKDGKGMTVQLLTHEPGAYFTPDNEELTPEQEAEEEKLFTVPVPATDEELQELADVCYKQYNHKRFYNSVLTADFDGLLGVSKDPAEVVDAIENFTSQLYEAVVPKDFERFQQAFEEIVREAEALPEEKRIVLINAMAPMFNPNIEKGTDEYNRFASFPCMLWLCDVVPAGVITAATNYGFILEYTGGNEKEVKRLHALLDGLDERAKQTAKRLYPTKEEAGDDGRGEEEPGESESIRDFRQNVFSEESPIEALENQSFAYPVNYVQDITKAGKTLFDRTKPLDVLQQIQIDVLPNTGKKDCYVLLDMDFNDISTTDNVTEYDGMVLNAVYSIIENGYKVFTAKQVAYIVYRGGDSSSNISPKQVGAVTKSIEKLRLIDLTVNWEQHAALKGLPDNVTGYKETGYLLPVKRHEFYSSGQKVKGYQLIDAPPLYSYAKSVGYINTAPMQALNVPGLRMDDEKAMMREYMIVQIGHMKNKNNKKFNNNMRLSSIMKSAGIDMDTLPKDKKSVKTKHIEMILQRLRQIGYIKNYEMTKKGRSLHAVKIIL